MSDLHAVGAIPVDPAPKGTRVCCIIGWPVEHSLSPAMHNAAFRDAGLDWVYVPLPVPPDAVADAIAGIRALGISGANVTMPHKRSVIEHLDEVSDDAQRIGAVNVIVRAGDRLLGANTDGQGFLRFLEREAGVQAAGANILLLGAGGAARAVGVALGDAGASVTIAARDGTSAAEACEAVGPDAKAVPFEDAPSEAAAADVIVNATPLGTAGLGTPIPAEAIESRHLVVDLVYAPPVTPLIAAARARGARAHNGIGMLIDQAALAFELWTGTPAPLEALSAAALRGIRDDSDIR
ncbi:MAG: shikimate dehydrogenase [Actinomycetota bacterium]|nr:shikimate dehydrogenase [Actinomycetota bacterium]